MTSETTREITYIAAIMEAIHQEMARDEDVVLFGQSVGNNPEDPFVQAAALRAHLGEGPVLVLTLGPQGYLLDDPASSRVVASVPRRVVENVPMVGAGDTFGAVLALHLARGASASSAAVAATDGVIRMLEGRA